MKLYYYLTILFAFFVSITYAQLQNLSGQISANGDVEGVHILNKSSVKYTVTKADGSFNIQAKANDTLVVSALKYEMKQVVITKNTLVKNYLQIQLKDKVNVLDEVLVGKVLTGSLGSDIGNVELKKEPNFYDLGIPGYTGKPKTISERKLADADGGGPIYYGLGVNFHKLLNRISGRTKMLRERVKLEEKDKCMKRLKTFYSESLFKNEILTEGQQAEYFYFCMDANNFLDLCKRNDPSVVIPFLEDKLIAYKQNLAEHKD